VVDRASGVVGPKSAHDRLEFERSRMRLMTMNAKIRGRTPTYFMNRARVAASVLMAFAAMMVYCQAGTRDGGFMSQEILDTSGQAYYQNAYTLIDLPSEELVEALPELRGLAPAADQQELPRILSEVGKTVETSYQKFIEIIANEQVTQKQYGSNGHLERTIHHEFSYLILPRYDAGFVRIEEYRTGIEGKPAQGSEAGDLFTKGFASMWAQFHPGNQSGSRFRYLGQQRSGAHPAHVIGFAQRPGWAVGTGLVNARLGGPPVIVLHQGVVWVDTATNKILKMRADLLKPRLDVKLEMQTTEIQFGEVHISDAASTSLWVPLQVIVTTVWDGLVFRDEHLYSNYKLPGSNIKIKSVKEGAAPPPKTN